MKPAAPNPYIIRTSEAAEAAIVEIELRRVADQMAGKLWYAISLSPLKENQATIHLPDGCRKHVPFDVGDAIFVHQDGHKPTCCFVARVVRFEHEHGEAVRAVVEAIE